MSASPSPPSGLPWKKLLLTTDFSTNSLHAWEQAKALAGIEPAAITLLHVSEPPFEGLRIHTESLHEEMKQAAAAKLEKLAQEHFGSLPQLSLRIETGRPASVICDVAKKTVADLIVIASHGHSGLAHIMLGSVVEDVVRHAPCAVLVVPADKR